MVVTCENCESKFKLDDSLIKDTGSKVRCSHCQHVFTVFKPAPVDDESLDTNLEAGVDDHADEMADEALEFDLFESEQDDNDGLSLEDFGLEETSEGHGKTASQAAVQEEEITVEDLGFGEEFSGDEVSDLQAEAEPGDDLGLDGVDLEEETLDETDLPGLEQEAEGLEMESAEEISFDDLNLEEEPGAEVSDSPVTGGDDEEEISFEDLSLEEDPSVGEETPMAAEAGLEEGMDDEDFSFDDVTLEATPDQEEFPEASLAAEMAPESAGDDEDLLQDGVPVASLEDGEDLEEDFDEEMVPPEVAEKAAGGRRISMPLMICLVVVLLGGGAYAAFTFLQGSDIKIPFLESIAGVQEDKGDPGNLHITLMEELISGSFVDNGKAGRLFVIKGKIRSNYPQMRNFIRMKGVLYFRDGKVAQDNIVYCGNVLSDTELQGMDLEVIKKRLSNRFGDNKANFKVTSGKVLPFMVVFPDVPQELGEFSVEVVDSLPG